MKKRNTDAPLKYRYAEISSTDVVPPGAADGLTNRSIKVAFSSETPVLRVGDGFDHAEGEQYWEVLCHEPNNADLSLLQNRGAVLDEHDPKSPIGVIKSAAIEADKKGRAELELDDAGLGLERSRQMRSKIRPHISVGYDQTKLLSEGTHTDGKPLKRFSWRAHEISSVAVPADPAAGVGRNLPAVKPEPEKMDILALTEKLTPEQKNRMRILLDPAPAAAAGGAPAPAAPTVDPLKAERVRSAEITKRADALIADNPAVADKVRTIVTEALGGEMTVDQFCVRAMTECLGAKKVTPKTEVFKAYSKRDQNSYSLIRAMQKMLLKKPQDGVEFDMSRNLAKESGIEPEGFLVPFDLEADMGRANRTRRMMHRDLNVNTFGQGGAFVQTTILTPIIEILRNRMVCDRLGVQGMAGLEGDIAIPRQTGAATAYSVGESAALTISTQTLDQVLISPKRVGAWNQYTRRLLLQSSVDVENFIRDDLMKVVAIDWDRIILNGNGAGSEPLGIMNTPGIGSIIFGGTATWAEIVSMETAIAAANADADGMAYVTTPTSKGRLKAVAKTGVGVTSVVPIFLWEGKYGVDNSNDGEMNGYRAAATNQIPNNQMLFGNFGDVIHALWGGYDIIVNPYTLDTQAEVRITVNTFGDVAVRHPASFCVSSDSAAQ
jgi:HK97 family phage major capsid protein